MLRTIIYSPAVLRAGSLLFRDLVLADKVAVLLLCKRASVRAQALALIACFVLVLCSR